MPTATDLVTDLPADFEVFGQAVDTSMADLKGGTTGQILSKATNADMDFVWTSANPGDITAVNTTAPLQGGATSGAVTLSVDAATTSAVGVVQLTNSTSSTSTSTAAVPASVKAAYDLAAANSLPSQTGNSGKYLTTNGTSASWATVSGKVVQIVNAGYSTPQTSTSSTYADTGLSASITPTSASNKILIFVNHTEIKKEAASSTASGMKMILLRGASNILTMANQTMYNTSTGFAGAGPAVSYLDSPATTSTTTYKTQFACDTGTQLTVQNSYIASWITLMEVTP